MATPTTLTSTTLALDRTPTPNFISVSSSDENATLKLDVKTASEDSAEEILSDSDLHDGRTGEIGLAVHSDCRPLDMSKRSNSLKSFDGFQRALQTQHLFDDPSTASERLSVADLTTRNSVAYRYGPKTLNRLASLDLDVTKRLKQQKHRRRNTTRRMSEFDGSITYVQRAHPLIEPLHEVDKTALVALIDRKRGRGIEFHKCETISRTLYDDVCRMLSKCHSRLNDREEDMKLAGQIGEAILSENGVLETMLCERSLQLAEVLEKNTQQEKEIQELKIHIERMKEINKEVMSPSASASASSTSLPNVVVSSSPTRVNLVGSSSSLSSSASATNASSALSALFATLVGVDAAHKRQIEEVFQRLIEFITSEGILTSHVAMAAPASASSSSSSLSNSPSPHTLPPLADDAISPLLNGCTSIVDLSSLLVDGLSSLQRKFRKDRRHIELERNNWRQQFEAYEKDLSNTREKESNMLEQLSQLHILKSQLTQLQHQLAETQSRSAEREVELQSEMRLRLQQMKKTHEFELQRCEEEFFKERSEKEILRETKKDLLQQLQVSTNDILNLRTLETQLRHDLKCSNEEYLLLNARFEELGLIVTRHESTITELTDLLSQLREESLRQECENQQLVQENRNEITQLQHQLEELETQLTRANDDIMDYEKDAMKMMTQHMEQMESLQTSYDKKLTELIAQHANHPNDAEIRPRQELNDALVEQEQIESNRLRNITLSEMNQSQVNSTNECDQPSSVVSSGTNLNGEAPNKDEGKCVTPSHDGGIFIPTVTDHESASTIVDNDSFTHNRLDTTIGMRSPRLFTPSSMIRMVSMATQTDVIDFVEPPMLINILIQPESPGRPSTPSFESIELPTPFDSSHAMLKPPLPLSSSSSSSSRSPGSMAHPMSSPLIGTGTHMTIGAGAARAHTIAHAASKDDFNSRYHSSYSSTPRSHIDFHSAVDTPRKNPSSSPLSSSSAPPSRRRIKTPTNHREAHAFESMPSYEASINAVAPSHHRSHSSTSHRLALLSSVGKMLSIVTGSSPIHAQIGSSPVIPVGKTPIHITPDAKPSVGKSLSIKTTGASSHQPDGAIYILPQPPFDVTPSDQLQLAYLYRYLYATWVRAFDWLDSCVVSRPARWIEDRVSGHCFSCQKHFTLVARRHHWSQQQQHNGEGEGRRREEGGDQREEASEKGEKRKTTISFLCSLFVCHHHRVSYLVVSAVLCSVTPALVIASIWISFPWSTFVVASVASARYRV